MDFKLQFPPTQIKQLASKFSYPKDESEITVGIKQNAKDRGYLTLEELQTVCLWKSERSKSRVANNLAEDVEALTKVFLETENDDAQAGITTKIGIMRRCKMRCKGGTLQLLIVTD